MTKDELHLLLEEAAKKERELSPREFELNITALSKKVTRDTIKTYEDYVNDRNNPKDNRFACFFILFTYYRKNGYINDMEDIVHTHSYEFKEHFLLDHIALMGEIKVSTISKYKELLEKCAKLLDKYAEFTGYLNQYVELCARYFELHLDERKTEQEGGVKDYCVLLQNALTSAEKCCSLNPEYPKLHANRGRIYALVGRYDDAERAIMHAISIIPEDNYHDKTVSSFENYYENITSIAAYDNAATEIETVKATIATAKEETSKMRAENLRNVSIVSAVFALLISGIQAFATISDFKLVGKVILMYAGLFFFAIGFICVATSVYATRKFKDNLRGNLLAIGFAILGLAMFLVTLLYNW